MKKAVRLFVIGFMTMLMSFNVSMSFAQSKGGTIKKGACYIGNMENPEQIAAYGIPAWLFKTMSFCFNGDIGLMIVQKCVYSINTYNGSLGEALASETFNEPAPFSYIVKNGNIYIWDQGEKEPKVESDYTIIFKIENDGLTLIQNQIPGLNLSKLVYMADYNKMKKMNEEELVQVEKEALNKLKLLRN
jgi:hypothetical protein